MGSILGDNGVPLGFGMQLMQNKNAFMYFNSLPDERQRKIIDGARSCQSRDAMEKYVNGIAR